MLIFRRFRFSYNNKVETKNDIASYAEDKSDSKIM